MIPILVIAAPSGTGKTTLLKALIPELKNRGVRCGLIKHSHHQMDIDTPGKDSYELRKSGADQVIIASQQRWALITETPDVPEWDLRWLASRMDPRTLDLILVEGFKHELAPKILLHRESLGLPLTFPQDEWTVAVASDAPAAPGAPFLDLNCPAAIADYIVAWRLKEMGRKE